MREITVTGVTVEDAVGQAAEQLGLSADELTYEVLELPAKKLFGQSPAKIKVTAPDEVVAPEPVREAAPAEVRRERAPQADRPRRPHTEREQKPEHKREPAPEAEAFETEIAEADLPENAVRTLEYLRSIIEGMSAKDIAYSFFNTENGVKFALDGEDSALVIGRRGETMEALQYLCTLVNSRANKDYVKITLDVSGYRKKREATLQSMAQRIGTKVQKTHRSQTLPPMNPYERRIVHSAVQLIPGVKSESTGEDPNRRIVISPEGGSRGGYGNPHRRDSDKGYGKRPYAPKNESAPAETGSAEQVKTEKQPSADASALYTKIEF